jgi:PilZ domain
MGDTRSTPRYPFRAPAEVVVESSGAKIACRVKEISLHGCYLEGSIPLNVKTQILVKIYGIHDYFEGSATVIPADTTVTSLPWVIEPPGLTTGWALQRKSLHP